MKWKEFKSRITNLGFEEEGVFDDNIDHIIQATNRANVLLHQVVEPREKVFSYTVADGEVYNKVDLSAIENFTSKSAKPPKIASSSIGNFYYVEDVLYISSEYAGNIVDIYYNALVDMIVDDDDEQSIDCREDLVPFLELLTAYFMWLDDDERKAIIYYNQFQEMYSSYLNTVSSTKKLESMETTAIAKIEGGVDI